MLYYVYTAAVGSTDLTFKTERWFVVIESITVQVSFVCGSIYTRVTQNKRLLFYCNVNCYLPDKRGRNIFRELDGFRTRTVIGKIKNTRLVTM